jgi:cell division protein FtsL
MTKLKKNETPNIEKGNSKFKAICSVLIIAVIILAVSRVVLGNVLATSTERLVAANKQIDLLEEENTRVENQISSLTSISKIETEAKKIGLVKADNVEILHPSEPIASR